MFQDYYFTSKASDSHSVSSEPFQASSVRAFTRSQNLQNIIIIIIIIKHDAATKSLIILKMIL